MIFPFPVSRSPSFLFLPAGLTHPLWFEGVCCLGHPTCHVSHKQQPLQPPQRPKRSFRGKRFENLEEALAGGEREVWVNVAARILGAGRPETMRCLVGRRGRVRVC